MKNSTETVSTIHPTTQIGSRRLHVSGHLDRHEKIEQCGPDESRGEDEAPQEALSTQGGAAHWWHSGCLTSGDGRKAPLHLAGAAVAK